LQTVVQELSWALELGCCNAAIYDSEQRISQVRYEYTASIPGYQNRTVQMNNCPEIYQRLLQGDSIQFCILTDHSWRGQVALFAFPIQDGEVIGDIWLASHTDRILDELEIRLIQQVTNQCAIALRQARLYQAAQVTVAELERLNQLKDDFLSTVSHELRSPLANMRLAIQMLERNTEHSQMLCGKHVSSNSSCNKSATYLQILHDECEREINLVEDLLDLQRLEAGHQSQRADVIQLQEFISSIVASFEERISARQQTLILELNSNLPDLVTDATSFKRIVTELLHNACKYTPPQESITVAAYPQAGKLYLSVTNSGIEISAQEAPRIFDKFYRIPNGDPWKQGGTGLGLALVKKLVNHLGGSIQVTSASRQTCFTIELGVELDCE
jgi:signal transduction histidine kinase